MIKAHKSHLQSQDNFYNTNNPFIIRISILVFINHVLNLEFQFLSNLKENSGSESKNFTELVPGSVDGLKLYQADEIQCKSPFPNSNYSLYSCLLFL